jgi:hypothetical protein
MQGVAPTDRELWDAETVCGHGAEMQRVLLLGRLPQESVPGFGAAGAKAAASSLKTGWSFQRILRPDIPAETQVIRWEGFTNTKSAEPLPVRGRAAEWACDAALTLVSHADKLGWTQAKRVSAHQALKMTAVGETRMLYKELTAISIITRAAHYEYCKPLAA